MELLKFEYFTLDNPHDMHFNDGFAWSRVYEYKFVLDILLQDKDIINKSIHNTAWGFEGVHKTFKDSLESICNNVTNSDRTPSKYPNTIVHDITIDNPDFYNKFDYVLNISTLEHIQNFSHDKLILQQLKQVKENGLLIVTFDLPGLHVPKIESLFKTTLQKNGVPITGSNSVLRNPNSLNCGKLIIKKLAEPTQRGNYLYKEIEYR